MENIPVTAYSGFSNVRGEITLRKVIENITTGIHAKSVSKIRLLVGQGKMEEANNVKKQLPFYTVTAGYREKRQAYSVIRYTHITLLDIDDQPEEKLEELRGKINGDPDTLASFLTPKGHGFKVFVFLKTDYATRLRATLAAEEKVGFSTLEKHHLAMYNACKEYYEKLLGVEVDGSGKDISRGFFTSFDEKAYLNEGLLKEVDETLTNIIPPEKPQPGRRKVISGKVVSDKPENEGKPKSGNKPEGKKAEAGKPEAEPWEKMEFNKAVLSVKRISKFEPGNRDSFMFALGNKCYAKGLEEETVIRLAQEKLGSEEFDVAAPIRNAYIYTDKTYEALGRKQEKPDTINLTYEIVYHLTANGMGQSTAIGMGGDPVVGLYFRELLEMFQNDKDTESIVMIGEIGGNAEELAAEYIKKHVTKPVVAFIAGQSAPPGKQMGHAGAIISGNSGSAEEKIAALTAVGIQVANEPAEVPILLKASLPNK